MQLSCVTSKQVGECIQRWTTRLRMILSHIIIKNRAYIIQKGHEVVSNYIARNTSFPLKKAMALNNILYCSSGRRWYPLCMQSSFTVHRLLAEAIRRWANKIYHGYFGEIVNTLSTRVKVIQVPSPPVG